MKKRNLITVILIAVFVLSAVSVWALANYQKNLNGNYAKIVKCKAQGDFMPNALNDELLTSTNQTDENLYAAIHGDYCPRPLKEEEYKDPEIHYID